MNTRSFAIGFAVMDSLIEGVVTTKRGIVHAAKSTAHGVQVSVHGVQTSVLSTSEAVTSFFAGASQAIKYRRGTCRMLGYDGNGSEE